MSEPTSVDVCIATCHRPRELRELLRSLRDQRLPEIVQVTVCVADNDERGSGRDVCEAADSAELPVRYVCEPERNIARARNASLALGEGVWVAIVDDDERVGSGWLGAYLAAAAIHDADVFHGPVHFSFREGCANWIARCRAFSRGGPLPTGSVEGYVRSTTNCFFRRSVLERASRSEGEWFDPDYGRSGSEDSDLFDRLEAAGAGFAWCEEAVTHEEVPPERATIRWLLLRELRFGMNLAHRERRNKPRAEYLRAVLVRHRQILGSTVKALGSAAVLRRQAAFDHLLTVSFFLGFMTNHYTRKRFNAYW